MTDRELDARCAELMKAEPRIQWGARNKADRNAYCYWSWCREDVERLLRNPIYRDYELASTDHWPSYSTDLNRARELEDEIQKRGWHTITEYDRALRRACGILSDVELSYVGEFKLIHATARQRAEAFVDAMGGAK